MVTEKMFNKQNRRDKPLKRSDVIATREYIVKESSPREVVLVKLGRPRLRHSDGLYECGTEIVEGGRIWVRHLVGADELEALQLAIILLGTDLAHINDQVDRLLSWANGEHNKLGVPLPPDFSLSSIMDE